MKKQNSGNNFAEISNQATTVTATLYGKDWKILPSAKYEVYVEPITMVAKADEAKTVVSLRNADKYLDSETALLKDDYKLTINDMEIDTAAWTINGSEATQVIPFGEIVNAGIMDTDIIVAMESLENTWIEQKAVQAIELTMDDTNIKFDYPETDDVIQIRLIDGKENRNTISLSRKKIVQSSVVGGSVTKYILNGVVSTILQKQGLKMEEDGKDMVITVPSALFPKGNDDYKLQMYLEVDEKNYYKEQGSGELPLIRIDPDQNQIIADKANRFARIWDDENQKLCDDVKIIDMNTQEEITGWKNLSNIRIYTDRPHNLTAVELIDKRNILASRSDEELAKASYNLSWAQGINEQIIAVRVADAYENAGSLEANLNVTATVDGSNAIAIIKDGAPVAGVTIKKDAADDAILTFDRAELGITDVTRPINIAANQAVTVSLTTADGDEISTIAQEISQLPAPEVAAVGDDVTVTLPSTLATALADSKMVAYYSVNAQPGKATRWESIDANEWNTTGRKCSCDNSRCCS
ncbi:hypothetical protein [Candidatus Epulonipiscium viviparus]|uniref:hypothetical protein n=1 Tax=Candidatus Epulonipiscium viviparus TaxID=420336 RepID=UPI0027380B6E|nr:hypothetical protein [Candidatus Epulopiscium viviparus]